MFVMDQEIYIRFLQEKKGETMCKTLNRIINKSAEDMLRECGQINQVPVDIMAVLDTYGIKSVATSFHNLEKSQKMEDGEILGLVLLNDDDVGLFYRETDSVHRQRFTIAHELGHCSLDSESLKEGYVELRYDIDSGNPKEVAANTFAGELLIPERSLRNIIQRLYVPTINGLADIFDVSVSVMRKRLEVLEISYYDDVLKKMIILE